MHGWMTSRHEGCVSTMLTDKRLKYSTVVAPLQGSVRRNGGCKTESTALRGVFGLDNAQVRAKARRKVESEAGPLGHKHRRAAALVTDRNWQRLRRRPTAV